MQKLIIEDDEGRTTVVPLVRDELTIGRKEGNTIRLTERNVSRRHARLFKSNGEICVEDFGSYTGVRVNGVRIAGPTTLRDSDQVQIGDYKLSVRAEEASDGIQATVPGMPAALGGAAAAPGAAASAGAPMALPATAAPAPGSLAGAVALARAADVPVAHLDASPTIPLRTLEEQGRAPQMAISQPARLVVVTTDLAGSEFRLDRPSVVIGRTDENDIILNHASISRHHAKVVRDGDRTTIVDLQSANGVRVAGESYERVDVQPGDVIELGHVKLRLVGPFENWHYDPKEFAPRSRRTMKIAAAGGGILLAGILVMALQGKKEPPPVPAVAIPQVPAGPTAAALLAEATTAAGAENWDKAVSALDLLLSRPPNEGDAATLAAGAIDLKRKVDFERRSAEIFASFEKAVADKEPDVALSRYDEIPAESVYKSRAEPALPDVKILFLAAHLDLADSARTQGRCDEAVAEIEKVQQVDPENRQAKDILKKCKSRPAARVAAPAVPAGAPVPAAAPGLRPVTLPHPVAQPNNPARVAAPAAVPSPAASPGRAPVAGALRPAVGRPVRPSAPSARALVPTNTTADSPTFVPDEQPQADAAELIRQARDAWMHQQCGTATDLSRRALKVKPSSNDAHQIIAACSCSTKDKEGALRSYSKLDDRSRAMVRTICARNGVELLE